MKENLKSSIACFWTVVLEKTLERPLDCKEIQPRKSVLGVHQKDWCWSWNSNTLATWCEELTPWERSWCWKGWRQEEKGMTEDEMVGWHHQLDGHEFEQALGAGDGQGGLACCSPWGRKIGHDWATGLNWTETEEISNEASQTGEHKFKIQN